MIMEKNRGIVGQNWDCPFIGNGLGDAHAIDTLYLIFLDKINGRSPGS